MMYMKWMHIGLIMSVCPHDSTREPLDGFGWNLVWTLCHWGLPKNRTFQLSTFGNTNIAEKQVCEVGLTLATCSIAIQWCMVIYFQFTKLWCDNYLYNVKLQHGSCMKEKIFIWPGFSPMTLCIQAQYASTELKHLMTHWYWFPVLKTTWFV
jgi:hypothetical protein